MLLSDVVEAEDDYTAYHCRSVVELVAEVADEMNIPKRDRQLWSSPRCSTTSARSRSPRRS